MKVSHPSWTEQEKWVWQKVSTGEIADFNKAEGYGGALNSMESKGWPENRVLRPQFLENILLHEAYRSSLTRQGVRIAGAWFKDPINISNATITHQLILVNSRFESDVDMSFLKTSHSVCLNDSIFRENVNMQGIQIRGHLLIKNALVCSTAVLIGARVDGQVILSGSIFQGNLDMASLQIADSLFMRSGAKFNKEVRLLGARIDGNLEMNSSIFKGVLNMDNLRVGGRLFMNERAKFADVNLLGARIKGALRMDRSEFKGQLIMADLRLAGNLFMNDGAKFNKVNLRNAIIEGQLEMGSSWFENGLDMGNTNIKGNLFMDERAEFSDIKLLGTQVGGRINMSDSKVKGDLIMEGLRVSSDLILSNTVARNRIWIPYGKIGGSLIISENGNNKLPSIDLSGTQITGTLSLRTRKGSWQDGATLFLRNTQIGILQDLPDAWPDKIELVGFTYSQLKGFVQEGIPSIANRKVSWIKKWLKKQDSYSPQPYMQLGKVLQKDGFEDKARKIFYASKQEERRNSNWYRWLWLFFLEVSIGYGYHVSYLAGWALLFVIIGSIVLKISGQGLVHGMPYGISYSLDMLLPFIKLNEAHYTISLTGLVKYYFYVQKIVGYGMLSVLIAGVSGLVRK